MSSLCDLDFLQKQPTVVLLQDMRGSLSRSDITPQYENEKHYFKFQHQRK